MKIYGKIYEGKQNHICVYMGIEEQKQKSI